MEQNKENVTWEQATQQIAEEIKKPKTDSLAMEMIKKEMRTSQAKDLGVIGLTVAVVIIAIGLSIINYKNDSDWRALFGEYDYVTQDGGGYNNINTGTQGDINNGAEGEIEN